MSQQNRITNSIGEAAQHRIFPHRSRYVHIDPIASGGSEGVRSSPPRGTRRPIYNGGVSRTVYTYTCTYVFSPVVKKLTQTAACECDFA